MIQGYNVGEGLELSSLEGGTQSVWVCDQTDVRGIEEKSLEYLPDFSL